VTGPDGSAAGLADPATVSTVNLDKYLVTVGRFRQFVYAWELGTGYLPAAGSGIHGYLNDGGGLAAVGVTATDAGTVPTHEPGWVASDDANIAPTTANLTCDPTYATWTAAPGDNESLPMNCATWAEAYAFCIWDGGFLPSEAEWENAAAGGAMQLEYPWGSAPEATNPSFAIDQCDYQGAIPDGGVLPEGGVMPGVCSGTWNFAPVGTTALGASSSGQLDMAGEVLEFVLDGYAPYVSPCTDCANVGQIAMRAARGGNFGMNPSPYDLLSSTRESVTPTMREYWYGFRCARAPGP
jgi:formylglycine-generating enzyme required for sulfatase activity